MLLIKKKKFKKIFFKGNKKFSFLPGLMVVFPGPLLRVCPSCFFLSKGRIKIAVANLRDMDRAVRNVGLQGRGVYYHPSVPQSPTASRPRLHSRNPRAHGIKHGIYWLCCFCNGPQDRVKER
jgi:hypothetical protein